MKKLVSLILIVLLITACASPSMAGEAAAPMIIATNYPLYDMALKLAGERINVTLANEYVDGGKIVLCTGGSDDAWADELEGVTVIKAMDYTALLLDLEGNPALEDAPPEAIDTDVLTVPIHIVLCAYALAEELARLDEARMEEYYARLNEYANAMFALDARFREAANQQVISCADGSMAYFAQEYDLIYLKQEENAILLNTFVKPDAEYADIAYIELMERNLMALTDDKTTP